MTEELAKNRNVNQYTEREWGQPANRNSSDLKDTYDTIHNRPKCPFSLIEYTVSTIIANLFYEHYLFGCIQVTSISWKLGT